MARTLADRRVLLALVVVVAIVCRAAGAGDSLGLDEGYSWLVASAPGGGAFLERLADYENTPPLFYLLLVPLPEGDEVWIRLPALIAGVAWVPVLYAVVRPLLGERAALLSALGVAVAPYAVSFSNYSRAFTLATLFMLTALWAAVRLAGGESRRWWFLYAVGAVGALWSQYYAPLFLLPLLGALAATRTRPLREVLAFGLLPFLSMLPWIGEIDDSREVAGVTKVDPAYPGPSPGSLRDTLASLFFGEHGAADAVAGRWLQLLLVVAALTAAAVVLRRRARLDARARIFLWLVGGTLVGSLAVHALVAAVGPDVFAPRYLTALIPLAAALLAGGVESIPWRAAAPVAAGALAALALAVVVQRAGRELEPDYGRARELALEPRPRTILTNSAVVAYYLRDGPVVLDRPFNLGSGTERGAPRPYVVVDDERVGTGVRRGAGRRTRVGPLLVRRIR